MCSTAMLANGNLKKLAPIFNKTGTYSGLEYWERFNFIQSSANWNKMFKKKHLLINNAQFEDIKGPEDLLFNFAAIPLDSVISYVDEPLYTYRSLENSLSKTFDESDYTREVDCRFFLLDLIFDKGNEEYVYFQLINTLKFIIKHKREIKNKHYIRQKKALLKKYLSLMPLSFKKRLYSLFLLIHV